MSAILTKLTTEKERFEVDFSARFSSGSISSATCVVPDGITVTDDAAGTEPIPANDPTISGSSIFFWVSGGTADTEYHITASITLSTGAVISECCRLKVLGC